MQVSHGWTEYACIELVHWSRASQALSAASFSYQVKVVDVRPQLVLCWPDANGAKRLVARG